MERRRLARRPRRRRATNAPNADMSVERACIPGGAAGRESPLPIVLHDGERVGVRGRREHGRMDGSFLPRRPTRRCRKALTCHCSSPRPSPRGVKNDGERGRAHPRRSDLGHAPVPKLDSRRESRINCASISPFRAVAQSAAAPAVSIVPAVNGAMRRRSTKRTPPCTMSPVPTGMSRPPASAPASASSAARRRPTTCSWNPRASRCSATSGSARCRICRSPHGSAWAGRGTYIQLHGTEGKWGCYVVEVPGAGALNAGKAPL